MGNHAGTGRDPFEQGEADALAHQPPYGPRPPEGFWAKFQAIWSGDFGYPICEVEGNPEYRPVNRSSRYWYAEGYICGVGILLRGENGKAKDG